jgi:hypothetical protein
MALHMKKNSMDCLCSQHGELPLPSPSRHCSVGQDANSPTGHLESKIEGKAEVASNAEAEGNPGDKAGTHESPERERIQEPQSILIAVPDSMPVPLRMPRPVSRGRTFASALINRSSHPATGIQRKQELPPKAKPLSDLNVSLSAGLNPSGNAYANANANRRYPVSYALEAEKRPSEDPSSEWSWETQHGEDWVSGDAGYLTVDVIDTGVGITPEEKQRLFLPFHQANNTIRSRFGGTGLGLWISKQIVTSMGGVLDLQSIVQRGTRFRVTIPLTVCSSEGLPDPALHQKSARSRNRPPQAKPSAFLAEQLRDKREYRFSVAKAVSPGLRLLIVEDAVSANDHQLNRLCHLLKGSTCYLRYATLQTALKDLEQQLIFDGVFLLLGPSLQSAEDTAAPFLHSLKRLAGPQVPVAVVAGRPG